MKIKNHKRRQLRKSPRRGAESIMRAMREIEAMIRDGARPEERFAVRTIESPDIPKKRGSRLIRSRRKTH
jgi:hypothetical protein